MKEQADGRRVFFFIGCRDFQAVKLIEKRNT